MSKKVRFDLRSEQDEPIQDPRGTLQKALKSGDLEMFRSILPDIRNAMDVQSDVAEIWIRAASENVSLLTHKYVELVNIILKASWLTAESDSLAQSVHSFVENLVSAHSNYLLLVLKQLIPFFSYTG